MSDADGWDAVLADPGNGHDFQENEPPVPKGRFCTRCDLPLARWPGGPCPGSPGIFPPGVMK
ncbi:hypothetical protein NGM36_36300 [Streptomyces mutabilis]|uniref:hypothetical protein n=1 Tax=Streptomyces mutabilis TaxID=67332 RepID=UPI0022BA7156|nr:hypothetical protein [Streptomyces mutabilis]MCZ9355151.1 hypothetical protein [Streptomyces mutabilis]